MTTLPPPTQFRVNQFIKIVNFYIVFIFNAFFSIVFGAILYFSDLVLFILFVAFSIEFLGLILILFFLSKLLLFNNSFLVL